MSQLRVWYRAHSNISQALYLATEHPSDFTIQYPPRREYFKEKFRANATEQPLSLGGIIGKHYETQHTSPFDSKLLLYCHIPFCEHKCFYCNFAVDTRTNQNNLHNEYVDAMIEALNAFENYFFHNKDIKYVNLRGIDIGGGTPTILEEKNMDRFLKALRPIRDKCSHDYPLSIETTPAIASKHIDRLYVLKENGVDRISMGMQSSDNSLLEKMNRKKEATLSETAIKNMQKVGFSRISADIIFGLPDQQLKHWENDLKTIVDSGVDVVTTYDCLYRGKGRAMTNKTKSIPPVEVYGELYDYGYKYLTANGFYAPYGSVNFSRRPNETGTSAYFEGRLLEGLPYIGLGNYASSLFKNYWWFAPYHVDQWLNDIHANKNILKSVKDPSLLEQLTAYCPISDGYALPVEEVAAKYLLLSLSFGVIDPTRFYNIFKVQFEELYYDSIKVALENRWLWKDDRDGCYYIVPGQFVRMPSIRSLFYSHSSINWITEIQQNPQRMYFHKKQKQAETLSPQLL